MLKSLSMYVTIALHPRPSAMRQLIVCVLLTGLALAQQSALDRANDAYSKQGYAAAATLFQQAAGADPKAGAAWKEWAWPH